MVKFTGHVTFPTYGEYAESAYSFEIEFPDGSVVTVPLVGYEPGFHEEDLLGATERINQMVSSFQVNEMSLVTKLMAKKNMCVVVSGPLVTSGITSYELRFDPASGWEWEWDHESRGYSGNSIDRFRNWADLFLQRYCNWGFGWPDQPKTTVSEQITALVSQQEN